MRFSVSACLAALVLFAPTAHAQTTGSHADAIARIEQNLEPSLIIDGETREQTGIEETMTELGVPGVSVAFFKGGEVVWTRTYGLADVERGTPVTPETRFQAASISKPVAATAALDLVEEGVLSLDGDVNALLTSWKLPENALTAETHVTLRALLTHTAGLNVHGFPGYGPNASVPTGAGVLSGEGNTEAVIVDRAPRTEFRYSGGGYTIAQQLIVDASRQPFEEVLAERVLGPLGMEHSTYAQPLPASLHATAATGYGSDGSPVDGRFHTYPEQAAAGLWTTPSDLARWAIAIQRSLAGGDHTVLEAETVRQMVTPDEVGGYGLGPGLPFDAVFFSHGGANEGFRCILTAQLGGDEGVVVMTNSDNGGALGDAVLRSIAREYGWEGHEPMRKTIVSLSAEALAPFAGRYRNTDRGMEVEMSVEDNGLLAKLQWNGGTIHFAPESARAFFDREDGVELRFVGEPGAAFEVQDLRFERVETQD